MTVWLPKGTYMKKILVIVVTLSALTVCSTAWSDSKTFQLSATIPPNVQLVTAQNNQRISPEQMTQKDQLVRDNRMQLVSSIVVP